MSTSPERSSDTSSPMGEDGGEDAAGSPEPRASRARRFGAFAIGRRVDRVRELQAEESGSSAAERPDEIPLAMQGVVAEMRRHLEHQKRSGTPRAA